MVIANEDILLDDVVSLLEESGMQTAAVPFESWRPEAILDAIYKVVPHVIVLEGARESNAWEICDMIRRRSSVPILMLGTIDSETAWVKAAACGVDFYARRPFSPLVLVAQIRSLIRRYIRTKDSGWARQEMPTETP